MLKKDIGKVANIKKYSLSLQRVFIVLDLRLTKVGLQR